MRSVEMEIDPQANRMTGSKLVSWSFYVLTSLDNFPFVWHTWCVPEIWDFSFNFRLIIITMGPFGTAIITVHVV